MAVGVGRRVEPFEYRPKPVEQLRIGDRIVEDGRLAGVVVERTHEPFGGCRHNVHVKVDASMGREPTVKTWCYTGGTKANVIS